MSNALYYAIKHSGEVNFGDYLSLYLYKKITGQQPTPPIAGQPHWVVIGSILGSRLAPGAMIWGSGIMKRNATFQRPLRIYSVRGPYTYQRCKELGYECPRIFGDPGLLLPRFYTPKPLVPRYRLGLIFHHLERPPPPSAGVRHITLIHQRDDDSATERIVDEIASCDMIYSSSLHGVIVAHAYGIPAVWCQFYAPVGPENTKFLDYYHSIGLTEVNESIVLTGTSFTRAVTFPQPQFPINTDAIWQACPFRPATFRKTRKSR